MSCSMVIHRPYLRLDPAANQESTEFCSQSAHMVLKAFRAMAVTPLSWMFWTMSYRVSGWPIVVKTTLTITIGLPSRCSLCIFGSAATRNGVGC